MIEYPNTITKEKYDSMKKYIEQYKDKFKDLSKHGKEIYLNTLLIIKEYEKNTEAI